MAKDLISIIIPTWNGLSYLKPCLESIEKHTKWPFEAVIVDNGSEDGTQDWVVNAGFKMDGQFIRNETNEGFAKANNKGVSVAKGDFICLLNNDTIVTENWLTEMINVFGEEKAVGAVGCLDPKVNLITKDGKKPINKIIVGDYVLTHKNRFRKVTKTFKRNYKGGWTRIKLINDKAKLIMATDEHPVLIYRNEKLKWIKISDVKQTDQLMVKSSNCEICGNIIHSWMRICQHCNPAELEETKKKLKEYGKTRRKPKKDKGLNSHLQHFNQDIKPEIKNWKKKGYKIIPISSYNEFPDFIAIKDNKVTAVEVEKSKNPNYKKYENQKIYDDVVWILKHKEKPRIKTPLKGFIPCSIKKIEHIKSKTFRGKDYTTVYNCEVEEDNSYVAGKATVIMHNCRLVHPGKGTIQHAGVIELSSGMPDHVHFGTAMDHPKVMERKQYFGVTGACLLTPKQLYNELGGLDEEYVNGWEDMDYMQKLRQAGYRVYYEPKALVYHYESRTPGRYSHENRNFTRYMGTWIYGRTKN
jgi:GT2 family glycosyltransferase